MSALVEVGKVRPERGKFRQINFFFAKTANFAQNIAKFRLGPTPGPQNIILVYNYTSSSRSRG